MCFSAKKKSSSSLKPLKEYQEALAALKTIYSQQQLTEYENALKIYTSRADLSKFSKEEATQIFPALFTVGKAYILRANSFNEGFQWFSHAITLGEKAEPRIDFASDYIEMGDIYSGQKQYDQGLRCLEKALDILNSAQGLNDEKKILKARGLYYKGVAQRGKGNLDGAAGTLAQAVTILEALTSSKEAAILLIDVLENLANLHYQRKDQEQAHVYSIKGLDLIDKTLGLDNFRGHNLARELACTLLKQKRSDEALVYAKKWENQMIKEHGANDPRLSTCYFLHGQICSDLEDYTGALEKFELAEKASKSNKNFMFEDSGELFHERARCYFNLQKYKEAREGLKQAIEYNTKRFGPNSKQLADCLFGSALIVKDSDEFKAEAKEYYSRSLEIYRKLGNACLFEIASTLTNFGTFLNENSEYQETLKMLPEALKILKAYFPTNKVLFESCYDALGMAQINTGNPKEGLGNLQVAFMINEETVNDSGLMAVRHYNLILAYDKNNQFEEAQNWGKRLLELELTCVGKGTPCIIDTLELLSKIYSKMNKEQEFKQLEAKYK